jgi:hypothetical protein
VRCTHTPPANTRPVIVAPSEPEFLTGWLDEEQAAATTTISTAPRVGRSRFQRHDMKVAYHDVRVSVIQPMQGLTLETPPALGNRVPGRRVHMTQPLRSLQYAQAAEGAGNAVMPKPQPSTAINNPRH